MKRISAGIALIVLGAAAQAEGWRALGGDEITEVLTEAVLLYELGDQAFYETGRTRYRVGNERWGWWEVRNDQYCSLWPPSDEWTCYSMTLSSDGQTVQFIDEAGDIFEGRIAE